MYIWINKYKITKNCVKLNSYLKLDCEKLNLHTGGKWLIYGTKFHKDIQVDLELNANMFQ